MEKIKILSTGVYAPGDAIDNDELMRLAGVEFDSEKIKNKLGIERRHIARLRGIEETTADFATKAAQNALADSSITAEELDLIVVATDTPEYITPATSLIVQGRLQKGEVFSRTFDIAASCASFTSAYDTVARMMKADTSIKNALVVGVYNMPAFVRDGDVFGYSIFADGAGAFILTKEETVDSDYIDGQFMTDGTQWDFVGVYSGGTKKTLTKELLESEDHGLENLQRLPPDRNVRLWPIVVNKLVAKAGLDVSDVDHFVFTQINRAVIVEVMEILGQPMRKTTCVMDKYGYTGSGCVPMAFHEAIKNSSVKRGDKVLFIASGAGFAVAANLFTY